MKNSERGTVVIRNFIYLDSHKLRSLSSQLFEGVAEQVVHTSLEANSSSDNQKGPFNSGRLLGEIFAQERSTSELRFLEDHAYSIFEDKLLDLQKLDDVSYHNADQDLGKSFVRVTARLQLNDLAASQRIMSEFNEMGEAIWRVTNESMAPDPLKKILSDNEARKRASESGLQMNKKILDAAASVIGFGFKNLLEANMKIADRLFSAPLKREFLREREEMIIHKYSRVTQRDFTVLGLVTQQGGSSGGATGLPDVADTNGMKEAMRAMAFHLGTVEDSFTGPSTNEVVIDPIALYTTIGAE